MSASSAPTRTVLRRLTLTDFRSYPHAELALAGGAVWLFGPNGAGKTNLIEAVSFLAPGRGLRGAGTAEVGRRMTGEAQGRAWAVGAVLDDGEGEQRLGTGIESPGSPRRVVRVDGQPAPTGRLAELMRLVWLTPQQDRLFLEGASERRRFFDRLTYAAEPAHAAWAAAYEKARIERTRLLAEGREGRPADPAWLTALERQLAESGAWLALARARTLAALQAEIDGRADRPFPLADLELSGAFERMALDGEGVDGIADRLQAELSRGRGRDAGAGRMLSGPHRTDLIVRHREKDRVAAECSTGEQKSLILNLVLAHSARLARDLSAPNPILLLDEVAAHLDADRRAALFDEIMALRLQAFLTGTDEALFSGLKGRAPGVRVEAGRLEPVDG